LSFVSTVRDWLGLAEPPRDPLVSEIGITGPVGNDTALGIGRAGESDVPEALAPPESLAVVDTKLKGAVGTANYLGFVRDLGEYNPKLEGRTAYLTYEKMRRSDADVRAALLACKLPIRSAEYQVVPGAAENDPNHAQAEEIALYVRENLFGGLESPAPWGGWVSQSFRA